jgi:hypothetical protein
MVVVHGVAPLPEEQLPFSDDLGQLRNIMAGKEATVCKGIRTRLRPSTIAPKAARPRSDDRIIALGSALAQQRSPGLFMNTRDYRAGPWIHSDS